MADVASEAAGSAEAVGGVTLLDRLRAMPSAEARRLLGSADEPASKQQVWMILHGTGRNKRHLTTRLLARLVHRLRALPEGDPVRETLRELYPEEFAA